jgi:hypothetical protein
VAATDAEIQELKSKLDACEAARKLALTEALSAAERSVTPLNGMRSRQSTSRDELGGTPLIKSPISVAVPLIKNSSRLVQRTAHAKLELQGSPHIAGRTSALT